MGARILPEVLRRFVGAWPDVEIRLTESNSDGELLQLVERGELDLAFVMPPVDEGPFEVEELMRIRTCSSSRPTHRWPGGISPRLREIAELPLIGFGRCRSMADVEGALRTGGLEPNIVFRSDDNGTVQGLVAAGVGAALVPRLSVEPNDERVAILDLERVPPRVIGIAWRRDRYRSPSGSSFVDVAREVCPELEQAAERAAA